MITITVSSYNGTALAQPIVAQFDELGGNIGRAENNQLVLPDPERTISRVHAQVVFRSGRYGIIDRGSNPISVNGRPLGNGQEAPLQDGDEVQIGGYALRVQAGGSAAGQAAADPFADFGGLAAAPPPSRGAAPAAGAFVDPLAAFGMAASPPPPARAPATGYGAPPPPPPSSASGIPDDWDPFAPDAASRSQGDDFARSLGQGQQAGGANFGLDVGARGPAPLIPDFGGSSGGGDSLDNLFGLGPGGSGVDPLANSVLARPDALPNMAANADPMKSLNSIGRGTVTAAADVTPELNTPFTLPTAGATRAAPPPPPLAPPRAAAGGLPPPTKGAVLSWDEDRNEGQTIIRPKGPASRPAPAPAPAVAHPGSPMAAPGALPVDIDFLFDAPPTPPAADPFAPPSALLPDDPFGEPLAPLTPPAPPVAAPVAKAIPAPVATPPAVPVAAPPRAAAVAPASAPADHAALIAALREGLRTPALPIDTLTPELMKLLGQLVHEATRGTVDLLVARAALKREIRAEMTMIVAKENNPLKFSPSVEVALNHLLSPPARGFMPPDRAMRDAYDDLRAHQFGFLAGLRAALEGVLKRFDPATLEGKLTQKKSMLGTLLPAGRKAKLWDVFQELYGQISAEAEDDFHELFGKEFLKAYEAYIERLDKERS